MTDRCVVTGKVVHKTPDEARDHIGGLYRSGKGNPDYNVYKCEHCGKWHVGHSQVSLRKRIARAVRAGNAKARRAGRRRRR